MQRGEQVKGPTFAQPGAGGGEKANRHGSWWHLHAYGPQTGKYPPDTTQQEGSPALNTLGESASLPAKKKKKPNS